MVTGLGLVTPAGIGTKATWERVCSAVPAAAVDPELHGLPVDFSCRVPGYESRRYLRVAGARRLGRFTQFALTAAYEAVEDAALQPGRWAGERVAVVVGNGAGDMATIEAQQLHLAHNGADLVSPLTLPVYLPNMVAGQLAIALHARGPSLQVSTACASGATAIGLAAQLLHSHSCDIAIAGGTEAVVTRLCASAFANMGVLSRRRDDPAAAGRPFDVDRDGFVLGEGAGILVLERAEDARTRGVRGHATLVGYGTATDAHHPVAPDPAATAFTQAIRQALGQAQAAPRDVDHVNAHGTGTPLNDQAEARALTALLGPRASVTSTKGVTGHLLGAAGAVEAALTVLTVAHRTAPPTANLHHPDPGIDVDFVTGRPRRQPIELALSTSMGFGGHNAVLAFRPAPSTGAPA
ncbi:3-oxoacyl-ACP synthase [Streptomyces albospinus]|uniref:3-oxoacyl-ACP synthase n=1 Tax=Streptomyces albospinus TaxID=285515 RepID=A0ABQ2V5Z8_9ACTN|nr:3-oxoacyl-ACP synthase [Streptomyces albospinus]